MALQKDGSRLIPCLIDFHVNQLIFNGNHKLTLQYFNKYHFRSIPYENSERFFVLIGNLLSNHHLVSDSFKVYFSDEEYSWRNGYAEIFANCLTLGSMIEMDDNRVDSIAEEILNCCSKNVLPSPNCFKQLIIFFDRKKTQLSNPLLSKLTGFFLEFDNYEIEDLLRIFCTELSARNLNFTLSENQRVFLFEKVDNSEKVEFLRFNFLIAFYPIVEDSIKERIKNCITNQLRNEFDIYKFYHAVILDVIEFKDSEFLDKFVEDVYPDPDEMTFRKSFYGPQDNDYPKFDMFFNLCFKFQIKPGHITDKKLDGFGNYYDWLLDMDSFDYEKFRLSWLGLYPTLYYFQEFAKYPQIKQQLEIYLKSNRDLRFERIYFDIHNPRVKN